MVILGEGTHSTAATPGTGFKEIFFFVSSVALL